MLIKKQKKIKMKLKSLIFFLHICKFCSCNISHLPVHRFDALSDVETSNTNVTFEKWIDLDRNETRMSHMSKERHYREEPKKLEITVALKDESDTSMMKGDTKRVVYRVVTSQSVVGKNFVLTFKADQNIVNLTNLNAKNEIQLHVNSTTLYFAIFVKALNIGKTNIEITNVNESEANLSNKSHHRQNASMSHQNEYLRKDRVISSDDVSHSTLMISVYKSEDVKLMSISMGWIYFSSWVVIFWPQIYCNWKKKSVIGLNFDYLAIVLTDLSLYTVYNVGLYCSKDIQREYKIKHDTEVIPVKLNDVLFGILGVSACIIVIIQCTMYKSGNQTISRTCKVILGVIFLFLVVVVAITLLTDALQWIDLLTYMSFVKIFTCKKYVPQIYMNFQRRSTSGFSVGSIFCDFNGGLFSMGQMIADSYNFDDWSSFTGNPTKFIVGFFTLVFDLVIILQHFVCYKNAIPFEQIPSGEDEESINQNDENLNFVTTSSGTGHVNMTQ